MLSKVSHVEKAKSHLGPSIVEQAQHSSQEGYGGGGTRTHRTHSLASGHGVELPDLVAKSIFPQ